jgi:mycothione reductase
MHKFDLIVIGSGSGLDVANAAAGDMQVAIVEKGVLGGTCLNRGCIPSKILIHSADVAMTVRTAARFGIEVSEMKVDFERIVAHANDAVDADSRSIDHALSHGVKNPLLIKGEARFVGEKTLRVGKREIQADKILIAAGGRPQVPDIPGLAESGFITSDEALRLRRLPQRLIILGGGYIAAELGHFFGALGSQVTIVQRRPTLLSREDHAIAERFTEVFRRYHTVLTDSVVSEVRRKDDLVEVTVENTKSGEKTTRTGDTLLVATGRTPNTDLLNLPATGLEAGAKGCLAVNEYMETKVKGIYALGDIVGRYLYKHNANHEAQYVYWNMILGRRVPIDYSVMPHAVFSYPQVAAVGLTEEECQAKNIQYAVGVCEYEGTGMGLALQDEDSFAKLIVQRSNGKILGCHIIGPEASTLVHEVIVAMKSGNGGISNILNAIHIHPALSEVIVRAASNAR